LVKLRLSGDTPWPPPTPYPPKKRNAVVAPITPHWRLKPCRNPLTPPTPKELMDRVAGRLPVHKDLAACAIVYKALGEQGRAEELLQTAEDYCMSGEEQIALAEAKFKVLGDKAAAVGAYEKALKETSNLDPLIDLAKNVMSVNRPTMRLRKRLLEKASRKFHRAGGVQQAAAASAEHLTGQGLRRGNFQQGS